MNSAALKKPFFSEPVSIFLTGLLCFSILINAFIPRFSMKQKESDMLNQILQSQSALICFFSFSSIPMRIVNDLFSDASKTSHKKHSKTDDNSSRSSSGDFSISCSENKLSGTRLDRQFKDNSFAGAGYVFSTMDELNFMMTKQCERLWEDIFLSFHMYMIVLPRSGIADGAAIIINNKNTESPNLRF